MFRPGLLNFVSGGPMGRDFMMVDDEETSLHRKYGYAIMALSVVVLAVLMVNNISSLLSFSYFGAGGCI